MTDISVRLRYRLGLAIFLSMLGTSLYGQSSLSISDVLPPYDLTATLLSNGHFSVTTKYTGEDKTLIYQEDGSGGRPVNYTSHIHFKVDDIIFQLPYELDPTTRQSPPANPLNVTRTFRDTVAGTARVNASMFGLMPDGDTIQFLLWMEPVKRPSGGFIRISAEVHNTSKRARQIGVLMLIDTKIGDNDRAPIISAFGYETTETEFELGTPPGMPPFWLGLEGTPLQPGLTARGNLTADGLITPDYFLFGNWKDNTAVNAVGLALTQWNERRAVLTGYTDSSILLLWEEEGMAPGERRVRASTEIGLVDSLSVTFGSGGWGGVGLGGGGLGGGGGAGKGCLAFDTVAQRDCADLDFHPYIPDSLQALFLLTNDTAPQLDGAAIRAESLPTGLKVSSNSGGVIPSTLGAGTTGVATLTFFALPRLFDTVYRVPVVVEANGGQTILHDTLCIFVPGLPATLTLTNNKFLPLCPGLSDTIPFSVALRGATCLDLLPSAEIVGAPADVAQFSIVPPTPAKIPANGSTSISVSYTATATGVNHQAKLVVHATRRGLNRSDRDTTVIVSDTVDLLGEGRDAEFFLADSDDTLNFGNICLGDTALREWTITNVGGCDLVIENNYQFENDPSAQFSVANDLDFPMTIERKLDGTALVRFAPSVAGSAEARFIVRSPALPFLDTLIVKGFGDAPHYDVTPPNLSDTLCPGEKLRLTVRVKNPTACPVEIDTIFADALPFAPDAGSGFILPPNSSRTVVVTGTFASPGIYQTQLHLQSATAGDTAIDLQVVVASRNLNAPVTLDIGDVRVGTSGTSSLTITATGSAAVEITRLRLSGADASEYGVILPNGETLPHWLQSGEALQVNVTLSPADIELRRANLIVETSNATTCEPLDPIALTGRGVLPILDAPSRRYDLGRICAGRGSDTTILLRNFGNAPLTVSTYSAETIAGDVSLIVEGLPLTILPDSSARVQLHAEPKELGPFGIEVSFVSDAEYFTPGDTLVRIEGGGILCGTIWADTVKGVMGDVVEIPIRIDASPLTVDDVRLLMNRSNRRGVALSIEHDPTILRFRSDPPVEGILSGLPTPASVTPGGSAVLLQSDNANGDLSSGDLLATLQADILLGQTDRTPLLLKLLDFADGWQNITLHNGLVLAEYCAIDRRYIQLSKPFIRPLRTPLTSDGTLQFWLPESGYTTVRLYDLTGRQIATLYDGEAPSGVTLLPLPPALISTGLYVATMAVGGEQSTVQVLIAE